MWLPDSQLRAAPRVGLLVRWLAGRPAGQLGAAGGQALRVLLALPAAAGAQRRVLASLPGPALAELGQRVQARVAAAGLAAAGPTDPRVRQAVSGELGVDMVRGMLLSLGRS